MHFLLMTPKHMQALYVEHIKNEKKNKKKMSAQD